jgi:hypothetical protein
MLISTIRSSLENKTESQQIDNFKDIDLPF